MEKVIGKGRFTGNNSGKADEPKFNYDELLKYLAVEPQEVTDNKQEEDSRTVPDSQPVSWVFVAITFMALILPILEGMK